MDLDSWVYWLAFVTAGFCGLLLAWLSTKNRTAGACLVAAWTGFVLGEALSNLIYFSLQSIIVFWVVIAASSLIFCLITSTNVNHHMLWVTSIFGSYLLIISVTLFVDRWPVDLNLPAL